MASHLGGGAPDPMVVSWPARIQAQQQIRAQFTDASTSPPWSLSWSGSPSRTKVDGIDQEPMGGTSFVHTFDAANAAERVIGWQ